MKATLKTALLAACLLAGGLAVSAEVEETSASLASLSRLQDAEPADLKAESTWQLPGLLRARYGIEELRTLFGSANVEEASLVGAEGEENQGVLLFAKELERRAQVFLLEEGPHKRLSTLLIQGEKSLWQAGGVRLGMSLGELVRLNGAPISYSGFDWDYGGTILDWHKGHLDKALQQAMATEEGQVFIRLGYEGKARTYPMGDRKFQSDDKRFAKLLGQIRVVELGVFFEP
jgi:hypothetical protein